MIPTPPQVDVGLNQYLGIDTSALQLKPLVEMTQVETAKALQALAEGGKDDDPVTALARKAILEAVLKVESHGPGALEKVDKMIFGDNGLRDVVDATVKAQKWVSMEERLEGWFGRRQKWLSIEESFRGT